MDIIKLMTQDINAYVENNFIAKIREKIINEECTSRQIVIDQIINQNNPVTINGIINNRPAKHKQEAVPPEKMKHGYVSEKVAVRINNQTIIFVEPEKIESAKQDWLTRYHLGQERLYKNKMTQDVRPDFEENGK